MWSALLSVCIAAETLETASLTVGDVKIVAEIADEPYERQKGLMYRTALKEDHGMLFVYTTLEPRSFWMKHTQIPLTIAYLNTECQIVHMADMKPLSLDPVPSGVPAMYALEMRQGWFKDHQITAGMTVEGYSQCTSQSGL